MEFDVVIVGGGPAGLSAACRLMQLAADAGEELMICLVEKGSEVGAHILSGAVLAPKALNELFPNALADGAPLGVPVTDDRFHYLVNDTNHILLPHWTIPKDTKNRGNRTLSLGNLCRWLGEQAEGSGVNVFPGFAASEVLYNEDGSVKGVATADMGVGADGQPKNTFEPGYELHAKYTLFAEGCRGHLGKELIGKFNLAADAGPQHYAIGLKELWDVAPERHHAGRVLHNIGWPLGRVGSPGMGSFLYHQENHQVALGLIVDLAYQNPHLSPFDELQRLKHHPLFANVLEGGQRVSYGARAIVKGGLQALPKLSVPGALLIGDDAGFLNMLKIKGTHTAMKSGMVAAETVFDALQRGDAHTSLDDYRSRVDDCWLGLELKRVRNIGPDCTASGRYSVPPTPSSTRPLRGAGCLSRCATPYPITTVWCARTKRPRSTIRSPTACSPSTSSLRCSFPTPITRKISPATSRWQTRTCQCATTCLSTTNPRSAIVRRACTKWWRKPAARAFRSTRRTAYTAKRATLRTRRRTSLG